jgi:hypothetical protein
MTQPDPKIAAGSLAANSVNPKTTNASATSQLWNIGLSKNGTPLNFGVTQSPLKIISFEVAACIPSSMSHKGRAPKRKKNKIRQSKIRIKIHKTSFFWNFTADIFSAPGPGKT